MSLPFDVLTDPARRRMLALLLGHPRLVGEIAHELGMSQPRVSKELDELAAQLETAE